MGKIKIIFTNILLIFLASLISVLHMHIYFDVLSSTDGPENYIIRCKDLGQYISEVKDYSVENINLLEVMEVDKEPFLFLINSSWLRIANISIYQTYLLTDFIVHLLTLLGIYLIVYRISRKRKTGILVLLLAGSSYLNNSALDSLISRQLLGNLFLLMLAWSFSIYKLQQNYRSLVIGGIFFATCIIAHRVSLLFSVAGLGGLILWGLLSKQKENIKYSMYIYTVGFILAGPYLGVFSINLWYTVTDIIEKYVKIMNGDQIYTDSSSIDLSPGVSLFTSSRPLYAIPILEYLHYQGFMLVGVIAGIKNIFAKYEKRAFLTLIIFLITAIYVCANFIFGIRILVTFDIFLLIFLANQWQSIFPNKINLILATCILITVGLTLIAPKTITGEIGGNKRILNIKDDPSVKYIKENIDPKESFLIGTHCANEFGVQIGYKSALNYSQLNIWQEQTQRKNGEFSFGQYSGISKIMRKSIFEKPFVTDQLKGKELYILFGPYFGADQQSEIIKIKNKNPFYFPPYISLIYTSSDPKSYVTYIFKVDTTKITYFDAGNYFTQNLITSESEGY